MIEGTHAKVRTRSTLLTQSRK